MDIRHVTAGCWRRRHFWAMTMNVCMTWTSRWLVEFFHICRDVSDRRAVWRRRNPETPWGAEEVQTARCGRSQSDKSDSLNARVFTDSIHQRSRRLSCGQKSSIYIIHNDLPAACAALRCGALFAVRRHDGRVSIQERLYTTLNCALCLLLFILTAGSQVRGAEHRHDHQLLYTMCRKKNPAISSSTIARTRSVIFGAVKFSWLRLVFTPRALRS